MKSDSVYIGRYVLVSYRMQVDENGNINYIDKYDKTTSKYE
jgi:hypothetical protein